MWHEVEFQSQTNHRSKASNKAFDKASEKYGCGPATLTMLLRHHELPIKTPSYNELCECLWLNVRPEIKGCPPKDGRGAYPTDVARVLDGLKSPRGKGIHYEMFEEKIPKRALNRIVNALKCGPVMCGMWKRGFGGESGHWIVITGHDDHKFNYLDPLEKVEREKKLSDERFVKHWCGPGLFLKEPCTCAA